MSPIGGFIFSCVFLGGIFLIYWSVKSIVKLIRRK